MSPIEMMQVNEMIKQLYHKLGRTTDKLTKMHIMNEIVDLEAML